MSQEGSSHGPENSVDTQNKGIQWGWVIAGLIVVVIVASFFLRGAAGSVQYYTTVSEYQAQQPKYEGKHIKLAGDVKADTLKHEGNTYYFVAEDLGKEINVQFTGLAPDTFKEGVDIVVEGKGRLDNLFVAKDLMAKCASKYQAGGPPPIEQMRSRSIH